MACQPGTWSRPPGPPGTPSKNAPADQAGSMRCCTLRQLSCCVSGGTQCHRRPFLIASGLHLRALGGGRQVPVKSTSRTHFGPTPTGCQGPVGVASSYDGVMDRGDLRSQPGGVRGHSNPRGRRASRRGQRTAPRRAPLGGLHTRTHLGRTRRSHWGSSAGVTLSTCGWEHRALDRLVAA